MKVEGLYQIKNNELISLSPRAFEKGDYEMQLLNIYDEKIATISGFGGAFTDSAAYNYHLASDVVKKQMLEELFGEGGLKYNFCRLCIGSSDFAVEEFCYVQEDDYALETFSIARRKRSLSNTTLPVLVASFSPLSETVP